MSKLLQDYNKLLEKIFIQSEENKIYTVCRIQSRNILTIIYKNSDIEKSVLSSDSGIGIYTFTDTGHLGFGSTNNLMDEEEILRLHKNLMKISLTNKEKNFSASPEIYELKKQENLSEDKLHYTLNNILEIKLDDYKNFLSKIETFAKNIDERINITFRVILEDEQWRISRSDGTDVDFSLPKAKLYSSLTLRNESNSSNSSFSKVVNTSDELLSIDLDKYNKKIFTHIKNLQEQLKASTIIGGHYPVLIDSDLCGMLTHEAFGHACESDSVSENGSVLRGKDGNFMTGTTVASECVSIVDHEDGLAHGFHPYGAFGNAREKVVLIENGILKESISDIFSSKKINVSNKNCERSESYSSPAIPRMSNTYLEIDKKNVLETDKNINLENVEDVFKLVKQSELLKDHEKILFLQKMMGGQVMTKSGDFMFGVGFVFEFSKEGIKAFKPCSFSGNVLEALKSIKLAFGEIEKDKAGICGKSGQSVAVNTGGPMLVFFEQSDFVNLS